MIDLLNSALAPLLEIINAILEPVMAQFAAFGLRESVVQFMLINAILGLSIYLTLNTGLFSLANAGFMAVGAYVSVILTKEYDIAFGLSLLYGALAAGLVALPIGLPVLRLKSIYLAIATIGFGEIIRIIILNFDDLATTLLDPEEPIQLTLGARGINRIPTLTETSHLVLFLLLLSYFLFRMQRSRFGRAMVAIRQDEKVAATLGINVVYYKNAAFILGAMIAGAAGGFSAHATRVITPGDFGFNKAVDILAYAVLGGLSHWTGPIIGGMALKAIPEKLRYLQEYTGALTGAVLLIIIIYLPGGLVSLLRTSFWRVGSRFEVAKRLASVSITLIALVSILPYQDSGEDTVLGYEFWGLIGTAAILGAIYWISTRQAGPHGGFFSVSMSAVAIIVGLALVAMEQFGDLDNVSLGYYTTLVGLMILAAAGLIHYPADRVTPPTQLSTSKVQ